MMPIRPLDGHGQAFTTREHLMVISWLQDEGFAIILDQLDRVQLSRGLEQITITADGTIRPTGDEAGRTAKMLLLHSQEHT